MKRKSKTTWFWTGKELPLDAHPGLDAILKCLSELQAASGVPVVRDRLTEELPGHLRLCGVETKQSAASVLYYWRKFLVDNDYVRVGRVCMVPLAVV